MRTSSFVTMAAVVLVGFPAAARSAEVSDEILDQLRQLTQRLDRLEQQNLALMKENEELRKVRSSAEPGAVKPPEVKTADRTDRVSLKADVRYRHERTDDQSAADIRDRDVLRARVAIEGKVNDSLQAGIGLTTAENGNPRGANQTLDGEFSRKSLDLDLAYLDWTFLPGAHLVGGKMKTPYFRPGQSLFVDNDVNPEGIALNYARAMWFGSAYGFWVDENVPVSGTTPTAADTMLYGLQLGARWPIGTSTLTLTAMYQDLAAGQGRRPFFNGAANGNTLIGAGNDAVLRYDFQVLDLGVEYGMQLGELPLQIWADFARNSDSQLDTAYTAGALLGKASGPGAWEAGFAYQLIEKDALFAQLIDSDFAGGVSDAKGWILRGAYSPLKNWMLNATYLTARRGIDVGTPSDYDRLLLDVNVKF